MYDEKNHLCGGASCIFCRVFNASQLQDVGQSKVSHSQTLTKIEAAAPYPEPSAQSAERALRLETLEKLAFFDSLTEIYNASAFMRELQEEVARAHRYKRPLSICILNINYFDIIGDKYGPVGEEIVLKHTATLLKEALREVDFLSRYQAEQFAIILPETNNAGALVVAERLAKRIGNRPVKVNLQTIHIGVSVAVASFIKHGQNRDDLIRAALAALAQSG